MLIIINWLIKQLSHPVKTTMVGSEKHYIMHSSAARHDLDNSGPPKLQRTTIKKSKEKTILGFFVWCEVKIHCMLCRSTTASELLTKESILYLHTDLHH